MNDYSASNQKLWDEWAAAHVESPFYDVPSFKAGRTSLSEIDLAEMPDVAGKSLLHLQCHFGLDTLSWARLGANVTGVDFSQTAIETARSLAAELNLPARFIQSDVFALPSVLDGQFDIVYTSYGVLFWLHDLAAWGRVINHFLRPGGTFFIIEYHPFKDVFENRADEMGIEVTYNYFPGDAPLRFDVDGSYAGSVPNQTQKVEYGWTHSMSEIINALTKVGLRIEYLHEFDYINWKPFTGMQEFAPRLYRLPNAPRLPYMFSLKATKLTNAEAVS